MINTLKIYEELAQTMDDAAARRLASVLGVIYEDLQNTVTKTEFNALHVIVQKLAEAQERTGQAVSELTEAQKRTEQRVDTLAARMEELAEAQKRTEQRMDTLAARMEELAEAQKQTTQVLASLSRAHDNTRQQVGGLARTMAYALENEAYRMLPTFLKAQCQIEVRERLIRTWINDEEINFYARARRDHKDVVIVGESVMRLDDSAKLEQLQCKLEAVRAVEALPLVPLLVTHVARPELLEQAQQGGVVVVQSFEWG